MSEGQVSMLGKHALEAEGKALGEGVKNHEGLKDSN